MLPLVSSHLCLIHVLIQIFIFQVLRSCLLPSAQSRQQYWQQWSRDRGVKLPSLCQKEPGNYSGSGRLFPIKFPGTVWHDHITLLYMCQVGLVRFAQLPNGRSVGMGLRWWFVILFSIWGWFVHHRIWGGFMPLMFIVFILVLWIVGKRSESTLKCAKTFPTPKLCILCFSWLRVKQIKNNFFFFSF